MKYLSIKYAIHIGRALLRSNWWTCANKKNNVGGTKLTYLRNISLTLVTHNCVCGWPKRMDATHCEIKSGKFLRVP